MEISSKMQLYMFQCSSLASSLPTIDKSIANAPRSMRSSPTNQWYSLILYPTNKSASSSSRRTLQATTRTPPFDDQQPHPKTETKNQQQTDQLSLMPTAYPPKPQPTTILDRPFLLIPPTPQSNTHSNETVYTYRNNANPSLPSAQPSHPPPLSRPSHPSNSPLQGNFPHFRTLSNPLSPSMRFQVPKMV